MATLTGEYVRQILGPSDDQLVARIIATGASREELAEALTWIRNDEAPMNAGRPLASGRVSQVIEVLEAEEEPVDSDRL